MALWVLAATPWSAQTDAQRTAELSRLKPLPIDQRLVEISAGFLGTPYTLSPLGEGTGKDPDPLIRFDQADCLSMVEETMAMALAKTDAALVPTLSDIRYASGVTFETRNHLMEAQWLPNNVKKGYLKDITAQVAGKKTHTVVKTLDAKAWSGSEGKALALPEKNRLHGAFKVDLVPVADAVAVLSHAPNGSVVVVVRSDRPTEVTRVTHVGFLVQKKDGPHLRHASRTFKQAVDEPLAKYVARNLGYAKWTVEGFALFSVLEPAPAGESAAR